jgi:hypothetical protein
MQSIKYRGPRRLALFTVALAALLAGGCGRGAHELETAPVRGTITLDGEPVTSGYIVVPTAKGRMASAKIEPDGSFVFSTYRKGDGVQVGTHPVTVNEVPRDEFSSVPANLRVTIPERYKSAGTSGLTVEVKPGERHTVEFKMFREGNK